MPFPRPDISNGGVTPTRHLASADPPPRSPHLRADKISCFTFLGTETHPGDRNGRVPSKSAEQHPLTQAQAGQRTPNGTGRSQRDLSGNLARPLDGMTVGAWTVRWMTDSWSVGRWVSSQSRIRWRDATWHRSLGPALRRLLDQVVADGFNQCDEPLAALAHLENRYKSLMQQLLERQECQP